jgi:hypothetical protein
VPSPREKEEQIRKSEEECNDVGRGEEEGKDFILLCNFLIFEIKPLQKFYCQIILPPLLHSSCNKTPKILIPFKGSLLGTNFTISLNFDSYIGILGMLHSSLEIGDLQKGCELRAQKGLKGKLNMHTFACDSCNTLIK